MNPIRLTFLAFMLLTALFASAQKPKTNATSNEKLEWLEWNEGYEKAVKSGKIALVDAYTDWCGWCKKMDRDTYSQPEVVAKINSQFIPIKFNPEIPDRLYKIGDESFTGAQLYQLLTQGKPTGFPTIYYIFPAKKRILVDAGYKAPDNFIPVLEHIVDESKK